jgi:triacylglycerol esterase/lipase EstA (alpha/beta hydrolase family)
MASPAGANDWNCRPSSEHPLPVILIHGTAENAFDDFAELAPRLKSAGYCVFAPNLGGYQGTPFRLMTEIAASAAELASVVDEVLAATGATQVDIVGHAQGGMMPRYYLKYLQGATKVNQLIALAPSNYGTTVWIVGELVATVPPTSAVVALACVACEEQLVGSPFLTQLNAGGDTVAGVKYTVIATAYDEIVTPYWNTFLRGPDAQNLLLQNICALDQTDHFGITYDPIAAQLVLNALDPSTAIAPTCVYVPPVTS